MASSCESRRAGCRSAWLSQASKHLRGVGDKLQIGTVLGQSFNKKDKLPVACPCLSKPRPRDKTTAVCDRFCNGCQLQDSWRSAFQRSMRSMWSTSPAKFPIVCSRLRISYEFSNSADAPCLILSLFSVEPKDLSGQSRHSLEWSTSYHDSSRFRRITLHAICRAFCRFIQIYGI